MIEYSKVFNISADAFCLLICIVALAVVRILKASARMGGSYASAIFGLHGLHILSNMIGLLFKGKSYPWARAVLVCSNFLEFAVGYVLAFSLTMYMLVFVVDRDSTKTLRLAAKVLLGVSIGFLLLSQFTGMYYIIDARNMYQRQPLYPVSMLFAMGFFVIDIIIVIKYRDDIEELAVRAVWIYILLPAVAVVMQIFVYGIYIVLLADTVGVVIILLTMLYVLMQRYMEKERENVNLRIAIVQSQVKPHFLYNVLSSICDMCREGSEELEALEEFSQYLRGNMESLVCTAPVPFEKELAQVKRYLSLEQLRFDERVRVSYDIRAKGFLVPMLSVQPLVENAVKHGLRGMEGGGTVSVSSFERSDCYEVLVTDDGKGFDPDQVPSDGKSHVGIENVRVRVSNMCSGTLEIFSAPEKGTVAMIRIPKCGGGKKKKIW